MPNQESASVPYDTDVLATSEQQQVIQKPPYLLFKEHVEYVRQHGDALDAVKPLESFKRQATGPLLGAVFVSHGVMLVKDSYIPLTVGFGTFAATILGSYINRLHKQQLAKNVLNSSALSEQNEPREKYELWNVKNKLTAKTEVLMHWQGTLDHDEVEPNTSYYKLVNSVRLMSTLAQDNDIKAIMVAPETLKAFPQAIGFSSAEIDLLDWAREQKGTDFKVTDDDNPSKHPVLVFTPEQLRLLADSLEKSASQLADIRGYVDILRECSHDHPLVRTFDEYSAPSDLSRGKLVQVAKQCVERRLDDVTAIRTYMDDGTPDRTKVHLSGWLADNNKIEWRHQGQYFDGHHIDRLSGMSVDDARRVIEARAVHVAPDVVRAVELLVAVNNAEEAQESTQITAVAETVDKYISSRIAAAQLDAGVFNFGPSGSFERTKDDYRTFWATQLRRKIIAFGMLAVAGSFAGASLIDAVIQNRHEASAAYDAQAYAKSQGVQYSSLTDKEKLQAAKITQQKHPFTSAYVDLRQAEKDAINDGLGLVSDLIDDSSESAEGGSGQNETSEQTNVGNVLNPNDLRTDWNIEAIGPIETDGYWSQNVAESLNINGTWLADNIKDFDYVTRISTSPDDMGAPLIKVYANVVLRDDNSVTSLPIMEGTDIVAASIHDQPVLKTVNVDGTITLRIDKNNASETRDSFYANRVAKVTYWLQSFPDAPRIKFIPDQHLVLADPLYLSGFYPVVRSAWEEKTGKPLVSESERLKAEVNYVKNHFVYENEPLSDKLSETLTSGHFDGVNFSLEQLKAGSANCNVAATLVALDNPKTRPVWGYRNDGDNKLTGSEGHMWLTDMDGNRYDPTPTKMKVAQAVLPNESTVESLLARKELLLAAGLGSLVLAVRRPLRRQYARAVLGKTSLQNLRLAEATVKNVLFSREYSPSAIHPENRGSKNDYLAQLALPAYHDKETHKLIRDAQKHTTNEGRRALRRTKRILRQVERTRPLVSPLAVDNVHSVL